MKLFGIIALSTLLVYLLLSIDLLIGAMLAFGIMLGILIRGLVLLNDIHKVLVVKNNKTALDKYLEERDRKENAIHFKE
ncbi:MAG TPA: hypothetical protein VK945_10135 [Planococcus sp. (in: firmicutes)]|nr:hypothetical protein [Planococcus sp. (in: firmicutes)]